MNNVSSIAAVRDARRGNTALLVRNYRAHHSFVRATSNLFYKESLVAAAPAEATRDLLPIVHAVAAATRAPGAASAPPHATSPVIFHAIVGKDNPTSSTQSWFNYDEAQLIVRYARVLLRYGAAHPRLKLSTNDFAVIAPFRKQVVLIRLLLRKENLSAIRVG